MTQDEKNKAIETYFADASIRQEIGVFCKEIYDDYYSDIDPDDDTDDIGTMVTLGVDCDDDGTVSFGLQSGDNSYTGNAYGFPYWGVIYPYDDTPDGYAETLIEDALEALPW